VFFIGVFLPLGGLPPKAYEPRLPVAAAPLLPAEPSLGLDPNYCLGGSTE